MSSLRCEVCFTILTEDGYCYYCSRYRLGIEVRDTGGRILTSDDFRKEKNRRWNNEDREEDSSL